MVGSVCDSVFSLLASRNQQNIQGSHSSWHTTCTHPVIIIIFIIIIIIIIVIIIIIIIIIVIIIIIIIITTSVELYKIKYIYCKNQAQLQKAGQQKMIKTNVLSSYI